MLKLLGALKTINNEKLPDKKVGNKNFKQIRTMKVKVKISLVLLARAAAPPRSMSFTAQDESLPYFN